MRFLAGGGAAGALAVLALSSARGWCVAAEVDNAGSSHEYTTPARGWHLSYNDHDGSAMVGLYVAKLPFTDDDDEAAVQSSIAQVSVTLPPPTHTTDTLGLVGLPPVNAAATTTMTTAAPSPSRVTTTAALPFSTRPKPPPDLRLHRRGRPVLLLE